MMLTDAHARVLAVIMASPSLSFSQPEWVAMKPSDPDTDLDESAVPHSCPHCHVGDDGRIRNGALQPHTAGAVAATALRWAGNMGHDTVWVSRFSMLHPLLSTPPWLCPTHG